MAAEGRKLRVFGLLARFSVAILAPVACAAAQWAAWPYIQISPFLLCYPVAFLVSFYGGLWPGLLSIAMWLPILSYYFLGSMQTLLPRGWSEWAELSAFTAASIGIVLLTAALRARQQKGASLAEENAALAAKATTLLKDEEAISHRLRSLMDGVQACIWEASATGWEGQNTDVRFKFISKAAAHLTGYPLERLSNPDLLLEVIHPEDRERVLERYKKEVRAGRDFEIEYRIIKADGQTAWLRDSVSVLAGPGPSRRVRTVTSDITAGKRSEEGLRIRAEAGEVLNSSLDYDVTLASIPKIIVPNLADDCMIHLWSDDGRLRLAASAHADPSRAKKLQQLEDWVPAEVWNPALSSPETSTQPLLLGDVSDRLPSSAAVDGEQEPILRGFDVDSAIVVPLSVHGRKIGAMTWCFSRSGGRYDTTDLALAADLGRRTALAVENARLYKTSERNVEARDKFLAILGHELRNPLSAISNAVRLLEHQLNEHDRSRYSDIISRQTRNMSKLIDDLLDIARVTAGKITLQPQPLDLRRLAAECVETCRAEIDRKHHQVSISTSDDAVVVEGDPVRLEQLLTNLLSNSIKYTPAGGELEVSVRREGERALISVKDNGIGIPPEMLNRIFEQFTRVEPSVGRSSGLGLGLALVRQLAALHGGTVEASSAGVGRGSEFLARLPLAQGEYDAAIGGADAGMRNQGSRRVLIVEDDADGRETLRDLLKRQGHEVAIAGDGAAALQMARLVNPEVAVIDIGLPDFDGYEVAKRLLNQQSARPLLIALTGFGQPEDRVRAVQAGFDRHLVKPVNIEELLRLVSGGSEQAPERRLKQSG